MLKIGVWGPGSMGVIALRGVIDHPELELVDVVVHSDPKAGRDAGELCGIAPTGVIATQDPAAMLAGDADVVVYAAGANLRPLEAVEDMVSILRAGKNVVSCSVVPLVFPDAVDAAFTDPLRQAAQDGGVSFFTTGIDSGFANDALPVALSGVSRVIESIRVTEMFNYATYPDKAAVSTASRSRDPRACDANSRWPRTTTTIWARAWPASATAFCTALIARKSTPVQYRCWYTPPTERPSNATARSAMTGSRPCVLISLLAHAASTATTPRASAATRCGPSASRRNVAARIDVMTGFIAITTAPSTPGASSRSAS